MQEPHNISLYPGTGSVDGKSGDHILIAPAYTVTEHDVRHIVDTTARVIQQFFHKYTDKLAKNGSGSVSSGRRASQGV